MSAKVILIIIDGLGHNVAEHGMGYLLGLEESGIATRYKMQCELPSLSRPLYETILTGETPVESGIVHNQITRRSKHTNIFSLASNSDLVTAAAAYHWFSELYNQSPYNAARDRHTHAPESAIQHGCFYHRDDYPDDHLFLDAEWLRASHDPDFILIHPMSVDHTGHLYGGDSPEYRNAARAIDTVMSDFIPAWITSGYQILVTADHGMNSDKSHGGNQIQEREIPLFVIGNRFSHAKSAVPRQTDICGNVCELLGIQDHGKSTTAELLNTPII